MKTWSWVAQYGIAIILALFLGTLLGSVPLFKETTLGHTKLNASRMVEFLGYGGALLLLWLLGRRVAIQLSQDGNRLSFLHHVIRPLTTLIVVPGGYNVLLLIGAPFLDKAGKTIYNWAFVVMIIGAALWLTLAWFLKSAPLMESLETLGHLGQSTDPESSFLCPHCGKPSPSGMKFCGHCGAAVG